MKPDGSTGRDGEAGLEGGLATRPAVPGDEPALAAMVREYWRFEGIDAFDEGRVRTVLSSLLENPALGQAWIAERNGTPAGYVVACFVLSIEQGGVMAAIDELFVRETERGSGAGSRLLETALAALAAAGCVRVSLEVGKHNDRGKAFYARHGFTARDHYELLDRPMPSGHRTS